MATYYVDTLTGNDNGDGSISQPWKHTALAIKRLAAGDRLIIAAPSTAPDRGTFASAANGTSGSRIVIGGGTGSMAYLSGGVDISQGSVIGNLIPNGDCESWEPDGSMWLQAAKPAPATGSYGKESSVIRNGSAAIKAVRVSTNMYPGWQTQVVLPAFTQFVMSYWHREVESSIRPRYEILDYTPTYLYLQADGVTWGTAYTFDPVDNSQAAWREVTRTFTTNRSGIYRLNMTHQYAGTYYVDDISLTPASNSYAWSVHDAGNNVYKLIGFLPIYMNTISRCTKTAWNLLGVDALEFAYRKTSLVDCAATPNSFYYETGTLYYRPKNGESISDLHIEASKNGGTVNCFSLSHNYIDLENVTTVCGNGNGVEVTGANNNLKNVNSYFNYGTPVKFNGAAATGNVYEVGDCGYSQLDGVQNISQAEVEYHRVTSHHSRDDGFQPSWGSAKFYNCISHSNGHGTDAPSCGWECGDELGPTTVELYNCLAHDNMDGGFSFAYDTTVATIKNSVGVDNGTTRGDFYITNSPTVTHDYNVGETKSASWTLAVHEVLADPLLADNYRPLKGSPCVRAGVDVGLTTDADGNTIPTGAGFDIGPYFYRPEVDSGYSAWCKCDGATPVDGQIFKSHAAPIAARKITVFPGVASAGQIREAGE